LSIPCLFTINNIHSAKSPLSYIEDQGIDAANFWDNLYYEKFPTSYEETRETNPAYFLLSGVFAAHYVLADRPTLATDMAQDSGGFFRESLHQELTRKRWEGRTATFNHSVNVQQYIGLYERILERPITNIESGTFLFQGDPVPNRKRSNRALSKGEAAQRQYH
jgi:hypothetical protein